ncbi:methyltransferase domain-containing protein [Ramlibacter sp. USB13]|uniref:Methyltransferase domain-containing protein n=1 Tax=Ramlibacter cellulosilyticus TaxID=2764187 RepID=A0A923SGE5_9BURK|nr:methyltransferase domain-containing protein [Ramlibacter cellulosilyticus]MBC5784857.1 methyltransferase domain-containing protein [Ramlibacter cellulosilyticus]
MHDTALHYAEVFFRTYVGGTGPKRVVDIGSQDVNGSLRSVAPADCEYIGLDFVEGKGVDVRITDPYNLPLETGYADVCVSSSCYEHSEFFWLAFLENMRILKPGGLFYLNVPSNGYFHRYPVDCWRFYPDSGTALQNWGRRNGYPVTLLESFVGKQKNADWNDFIAVFAKDDDPQRLPSQRMLDVLKDFTNGKVAEQDGFRNYNDVPEDMSPMIWQIRKRFRRLLRPAS